MRDAKDNEDTFSLLLLLSSSTGLWSANKTCFRGGVDASEDGDVRRMEDNVGRFDDEEWVLCVSFSAVLVGGTFSSVAPAKETDFLGLRLLFLGVLEEEKSSLSIRCWFPV